MGSANRRIANNTIYMYIRLFTTLVIGLYTMRLVLEILGVSDYGIYTVIGGVLAMFTFISSSLVSATSRFFNYEMGKSDGDVNTSFNINLILHIGLSAIIFVLAETIGLWYVCNVLNIADDKLSDAVFVFHISMFTACLGIINSPYQSVFNAKECFKFLSIIDIINSIIRLGCVLMLSYLSESDGITIFSYSLTPLKLYALIMSLTTLNCFVVYHYVARRRWPNIVTHNFIFDWKKYREVLHFGGWNLLATLAYMARTSGTDLIVNSFFGTAVNGAFAISKNVNQYVSTFTANFDSASAPQIIQSYSAGNAERSQYLANKMGRLNLLIFELVFFPLSIELDLVLHLWLGNVPDGALTLTQVNLIVAGVAMTGGGIFNIINASGKVKWFKIELSLFFIICLPAGAILFHYGFPPYSILVCYIIADVLQRAVQLYLANLILKYDSWRFVKEAYGRPFVIAVIMTTLCVLYPRLEINSSTYSLIAIGGCFLVTTFLVWTIGLEHNERNKILTVCKQRIANSFQGSKSIR